MSFLPGVTRIGWIGTGVMGRYMCEHIMNAGYSATVYSRTPSKCEPLINKGAILASSPKEVAQNSDIVFVMVGYPSDVREVILNNESGIIFNLKEGGIIVDMTTSEPSLAVEIYNIGKINGINCLDAPVSGGDIGAKNATLSIMVGGDQDTVNKLTDIFGLLGKNINYMGECGNGQHTKMVNQILIASNMIGVCEGLLYGYKSGLNLNDLIKAIGSGAAGSWSINNLGPRIVNRNFDPGFFVDHFVKDMEIALIECKRMNIKLKGLELANELYHYVQEMGNGRLGTHSLMLALEKINFINR